MLRSTRIDIAVIAVLIACTSSLLFNELVPRSFVIVPGQDRTLYTTTDQAMGGKSTAAGRTDDSAFALEYSLADAAANPYAALGIPLQERSFDWFDRIVVRARSAGTAPGRYRIYIRNVDAFSEPGNWSSQRQNESNFEAAAEYRDIVIPRESFKVPTWWLESYGLGPEDGVPRFDKAVEISLSTGALSRSGSGVLEIESISIEGRWVPKIQLYRLLLVLWAAGILFIALRRNIRSAKRMLAARNRVERIRDINRSLSRERLRMTRIAYRDELTGVLNRAGLNEKIAEILDNRSLHGFPFCLILFDVDDFKTINDTRGHAAGDRALADLTALIKDLIRDTDLLCRWGGEEFVIIGTGTTLEKGVSLAEKLREAVAQSDLGFTCSFGVAENPEDDFEGIFQAADDALYEAKHSGKDKVVSAG